MGSTAEGALQNDGSGGSVFSISWWHHSSTHQNLSEIQGCLGYTYCVQRESKAGLCGAFPTSQPSAGQGGTIAVHSEDSLVCITRLSSQNKNWGAGLERWLRG